MFDQYFTSDGCDVIDDLEISFYDCQLVVPIGPYKAGDTVSGICVDFEDGTIHFYESEAAEEPAWSGRVFGYITEKA